MEDLISRQVVLDLAEWFRINQQHFTVDNLIDEVENIPSVTPKVAECEDAISRADTIEWLKRVTVTDGITFETGFKQILTDIQNMPSVNPKPKMGRWISEERHHTGQDQEFDYVVHFCSECGAQKRIGWMGVKYCPECGTKMAENPTGSESEDAE